METAVEKEPLHLQDAVERCWLNVDTAAGTLENIANGTVFADPSGLQQLLENLFRNAVEHGGREVTVTVGDLPDGFYVADNGPGIDPVDRDGIFHAGFSTADEGRGFGRSIGQGIVEAHGWDLHFSESHTGGARFEVISIDEALAD